MSSHRVRLASLATLAVLGVAGPALAQGTAPGAPAAVPERLGWELGFGLYGGEINCENQDGDFCNGATEAGGFDVHANYFFRPDLGITLDIWPMFHTENDWTLTHNIATVGLKWRPAPIFTFTAGVGSAQAKLSYERVLGIEARSDAVPAVMLGAAIEVVRGRSFAIDLQARVGVGFYDEDDDGDGQADFVGRNIGLGAAATWF
jgi:hypothetical protein